MRKPLQDFSDSQYERPQCRWICGNTAEGRACPSGPNAAGHCPALAHCNPVRDGDRWQCNRSPIRGGPCDEGPAPDGKCCHVDRCHPIRSLRSRRRQFVLAAALITIGAILLALSTDMREQVLKPGALAYNHAQILTDISGTDRCATCHEAAHGGMKTWLASVVWRPSSGKTQSELCLECHSDSIHNDLALVAHNIPANELAALNGKQSGNIDQIACARCHREHNGAEFDLTSISNSACQVCHTERYHSFADDHPDFSMWPFARRTQIVFDHASHSGKHFPEKKAAFDCASCHAEDAAGVSQLTLSYEQTCAACHDKQMTANIGPGVALFSLPTIDVDALADGGFHPGGWPEWATGEFDGRISPLMKLLLASDPITAEAMNTLGVDFEFADIDPDDPQQLAAAATLVASIKKTVRRTIGTRPCSRDSPRSISRSYRGDW